MQPEYYSPPQSAPLCAARFLLLVVLACLASGTAAAARIITATPENYRARLAALKPGDTLQLAPGAYRRGLPVHRLVGTAQAPIVIRGPEQGPAAVFIARKGANTVSLIEAAHVHIRDLTLDGQGIPVHAVVAERRGAWAHHITLENLEIINHGASQGFVGIATRCPAWNWTIRGNRIHGAGTGMYLGNSDGSAPFYAGVIEYNVVTDPLGYGIQIKHQHARPELPLAPPGPHRTIVRHNVLSKANGGSAGPLARPNLLVGHWPLSGEGSEDEYLIYGNFLHENPHEALFQGEGNLAFYNNVLINRGGNGVHIQPHNDVPRSVRILYNTIVTRGEGIVVRTNDASYGYLQLIAGNVLYARAPPIGGVQHANASKSYDAADASLAGGPQSSGPFDPYPREPNLACAAVPRLQLAGLPDAHCDFNGQSRHPAACGAYGGHGRNPGWLPRLERKPPTRCKAG